MSQAPRLRLSSSLLALAAGVALVLVALTGHAGAQQPAERVVMTPAEGTLATRFLFVGAGFPAGSSVSVRFLPPDGVERRIREDGAELVWLVSADGGFGLEVVFGQRFPGAPPGRWRALFCALNAPTCQQLEFDLQ